MSLSHGRDLVAIPGPSIVPDRVLNAMHRAAPDIYGDALISMTDTIFADLRRVARTAGEPIVYIANGHAVWEAALANVLVPGEKALFLTTGRFAKEWSAVAGEMGIDAEIMDFGWRAPTDAERLLTRLKSDRHHEIKAVLTVQTDTACGVSNNLAALGEAIATANHPALFMADCIASLACEQFEMDAWGVDVMVAASQKGLMCPPGIAFNFCNEKAQAAAVKCPSRYWNWEPRIRPEIFYQKFGGTPPTHHLFALRESLTMILDDAGLEPTWDRHRYFAEAIWKAVECWGHAFELNVADPRHRSTAVTAIRTGPGDGKRIREWCTKNAGLTLGIGMAPAGEDPDSAFRIGHMGHLNPPMLLGAVATIETAMSALGIAYAPGGTQQAANHLSSVVTGIKVDSAKQ